MVLNIASSLEELFPFIHVARHYMYFINNIRSEINMLLLSSPPCFVRFLLYFVNCVIFIIVCLVLLVLGFYLHLKVKQNRYFMISEVEQTQIWWQIGLIKQVLHVE